MVLFQGIFNKSAHSCKDRLYIIHSNVAVDQELNAKDVIEIDRRLWRKFESLALYLTNKRGHHLTEKLPVGGRK